MPLTPPHSPRGRESGFTVVIIAALFIAFAVIVAAVVERNTVMQQIARRDAARDQLQRLAIAIVEYSVFNRNGSNVNLYPCPANDGLDATSASFGTVAINCYTGAASGFTILGASDPIRGMVPVAALSSYGIATNDAFDPWNNRIMYVVNRLQTLGTSGPTQTNNPTLTDKRTGFTIAKPDFILISYGRDGLGAISRSATSSTENVPCGVGETQARKENCDDDTTFLIAPTYTAAGAATDSLTTGGPPTFGVTSYFDDVLTWHRQ